MCLYHYEILWLNFGTNVWVTNAVVNGSDKPCEVFAIITKIVYSAIIQHSRFTFVSILFDVLHLCLQNETEDVTRGCTV